MAEEKKKPPVPGGNPGVVSRSNLQKKYFDHYYDLSTFTTRPITLEFLEAVAKDLVEWCQKDTSLTLISFWIERKMPLTSYHRWSKKSEVLVLAYEHAKSVIGIRREIGGLTRKYDSGMIRSSMAAYSSQWKELEEWRANLKIQPLEDHIKAIVIEELETQEQDNNSSPHDGQ